MKLFCPSNKSRFTGPNAKGSKSQSLRPLVAKVVKPKTPGLMSSIQKRPILFNFNNIYYIRTKNGQQRPPAVNRVNRRHDIGIFGPDVVKIVKIEQNWALLYTTHQTKCFWFNNFGHLGAQRLTFGSLRVWACKTGLVGRTKKFHSGPESLGPNCQNKVKKLNF